MNKVIILSGISGSGKSTYAASIENGYIVSADHYFMKDGVYQFNPDLIGEAHKDCWLKYVDALDKGTYIVVLDNTNTALWEMKRYVAYAQKKGYAFEIVTVYTDVDKAIHRNVHSVPSEVIHKQYGRLLKRVIPPEWPHRVINNA